MWGKYRRKWLTHVAAYNIIEQYDKKRNRKEPKPRSLAVFDTAIYGKLYVSDFPYIIIMNI